MGSVCQSLIVLISSCGWLETDPDWKSSSWQMSLWKPTLWWHLTPKLHPGGGQNVFSSNLHQNLFNRPSSSSITRSHLFISSYCISPALFSSFMPPFDPWDLSGIKAMQPEMPSIGFQAVHLCGFWAQRVFSNAVILCFEALPFSTLRRLRLVDPACYQHQMSVDFSLLMYGRKRARN